VKRNKVIIQIFVHSRDRFPEGKKPAKVDGLKSGHNFRSRSFHFTFMSLSVISAPGIIVRRY